MSLADALSAANSEREVATLKAHENFIQQCALRAGRNARYRSFPVATAPSIVMSASPRSVVMLIGDKSARIRAAILSRFIGLR